MLWINHLLYIMLIFVFCCKESTSTYQQRKALLRTTSRKFHATCNPVLSIYLFMSFIYFFSFNNVRTRGHNFQLYLPECRLDARKFSFARRVYLRLHGTIYHLMLSTLSAWTHSSVNWLMFVFYANVCRILYSYFFVLFCFCFCRCKCDA